LSSPNTDETESGDLHSFLKPECKLQKPSESLNEQRHHFVLLCDQTLYFRLLL